ncbi:MAG: hypothetical protein M3H12_13710, partial [Chromatiales bacterium]
MNKYLTGILIKKGFTTKVEPAIPTPAGIRYPDIIAWKGNLCAVVDTTIIADNFSTNDAHTRKATYYDQPSIRQWCETESGVNKENISFTACALNWRG